VSKYGRHYIQLAAAEIRRGKKEEEEEEEEDRNYRMKI